MDLETYDQLSVGPDIFGDVTTWLKPTQRVSCQLYEGQLISLEVPHVVELQVTDTPPVVKGATATNQMKTAVLETGAKIRVPPFIDVGEIVRVDTRTGDYLERAK